MMRLLKIEWLKMKGYSAFIVVALLFVLSLVASNYIVFRFVDTARQFDPLGLTKGSFFDYPDLWRTICYISSWSLVLPGFLLVMFITNEFSFRTHRQNIIDGVSRLEFINVKMLLAVVAALISTVLVILVTLLFGCFSYSSFSVESFEFVGYFFLKAVTYNLFAVLMAVLIRKTGLAISLFFIYIIIENILSLMLYNWAIKLKTENGIDIGFAGDYLPLNAADGLLKFPKLMGVDTIRTQLPNDYVGLVLGLTMGYIALFWFWSKQRMLKSDL